MSTDDDWPIDCITQAAIFVINTTFSLRSYSELLFLYSFFPTQLRCSFITTYLTKKLSNAARDLKLSNISAKDYERMRIDMEELQEALNRSQSFFSTISTAVDPNKLAVCTSMSHSHHIDYYNL